MYKKLLAVACAMAFLALTPVLVVADSLAEEPSYDTFSQIVIEGDADFTEENGLTSGAGTPDDPYIIDGWRILAPKDNWRWGPPNATMVWIRNTTSHVVVSNLTFSGVFNIAITLDNAANCTIKGCHFPSLYGAGILVRCPAENVRSGLQIVSNTFRSHGKSIEIWNMNDCVFRNNCFNGISVYGIVLHGCTNVTVSDSVMYNFDGYEYSAIQDSGILLDRCSQVSLERVRMIEIEHCHGINLQNTSDVTIRDSFFRQGYGEASSILAVCSSGVTVEDCKLGASDNFCQIRVVLSSGVLIRDNEIWPSNYYYNGVQGISSSNVTIASNKFNRCNLVLEAAGDIAVSNNSFTNDYTGQYRTVGYARIKATDVHGLSIEHNSIVGASQCGIWVDEGRMVNIVGNVITGGVVRPYDGSTGLGVRIWDSDSVTIELNRIGDNNAEEDIYYDDDEVYVSGCSDVIVQKNNISHDSLFIRSSTALVLRGNTFSGDNEISVWSCDDGEIYGNNFAADYLVDFEDSSGVTLDNGYPEGGNHWIALVGDDEYSGPDQDEPGSDGIIDEPFLVGGALDNYPLTAAVLIPDENPPITYADFGDQSRRYGWFLENTSVELVSYDSLSEVWSTYYRIDGGDWLIYESIFNVTSNGKHSVEFYSVDSLGVAEPVASEMVWIDKDPPVFTAISPPTNTTITEYPGVVAFAYSDNLSGASYAMLGNPMHTYSYWLTEGGEVEVTKSSWEESASAYITAYDAAGNYVAVSLTYDFDTDVFSTTGPYGPWFIIAVIADFVLLLVPVAYAVNWYITLMDSRIPSPQSTLHQKAPKGQVTKEDVEDGYPRFLRKI
ncbi:MAG TPA: right-handed parallel beta-helix repeat-containing protein [Thermoplasmata archaeon]